MLYDPRLQNRGRGVYFPSEFTQLVMLPEGKLIIDIATNINYLAASKWFRPAAPVPIKPRSA